MLGMRCSDAAASELCAEDLGEHRGDIAVRADVLDDQAAALIEVGRSDPLYDSASATAQEADASAEGAPVGGDAGGVSISVDGRRMLVDLDALVIDREEVAPAREQGL